MNYYNDYQKGYYEDLYNHKNGKHFESTKDNIFKLIYPLKKGKILDIGCGSGKLGLSLKENGFKVIGIDRNKNSIEFCKFKGYKSYQMSCDNIKLKEKFDVVLCSALVEHIPNKVYLKMLDEIKKVLKKKGILIIYTPNPNSIIERLNKKEEHIGLKTMEYLLSTLIRKEYEIERCYYAPSHIKLIPKRRICIRARLI
jgi:2-polyprenyl-3-methyl-5-hydroxy-6-metoxy-1,4-benzoquinol methylase